MSQRARLLLLLAVTVLLGITVYLLAPHKIELMPYKTGMVCLAGLAGYLLDLAIFPYAQPWRYFKLIDDRAWAMLQLRQAAVVIGAMITVGLGL